jgi:hypothetical protein
MNHVPPQSRLAPQFVSKRRNLSLAAALHKPFLLDAVLRPDKTKPTNAKMIRCPSTVQTFTLHLMFQSGYAAEILQGCLRHGHAQFAPSKLSQSIVTTHEYFTDTGA